MIQFRCRNCNATVRAEDARAGKKGRCPSCQGIVEIPPAPGAADDSVSKLVAALQARAAKQAAGLIPPDPREPQPDEIELVEADPSDETDTFPAAGARETHDRSQASDGPYGSRMRLDETHAGAVTDPQGPTSTRRTSRWTSRRAIIMLAVGAVLAAGATLLLLLLF